jgi:hypothetical protein
MSITVGDIIWTRAGKPTLVTEKDPMTGRVKVNDSFSEVQEKANRGIINGLSQDQVTIYKEVLDDTLDLKTGDYRQKERVNEALSDLLNRITVLKDAEGDPRTIRYLENELAYLMVKYDYYPRQYSFKQNNFTDFE